MLVVSNASLIMHQRTLVKNINMQIQQGEFIAICGPNGAGKSSLIRLLSGELTPTYGSVSWRGKPLSAWSKRSLACQRGLLQQHCEVSFDYSALEVVLLGRYPHHQGDVRIEDVRIAEAILDEVELGHLANQSYHTLSGGEQSRVNMARVLAQIWEPSKQARLLLLDEPTAALDPRQQHRTLALAKQRAMHHNTTVVAIVHDLNLAAQYADRMVLLRNGQLQIMESVRVVMQPVYVEPCFDISCVMIAHPDGGSPIFSMKR